MWKLMKRRGQGGFGFVEILVTLGVVSIIAPGLVYGIGSTMSSPSSALQQMRDQIEGMYDSKTGELKGGWSELTSAANLQDELADNYNVATPPAEGEGDGTVSPPVGYAVVSGATDDWSMFIWGLRPNGNNWHIQGDVHSNGGLVIGIPLWPLGGSNIITGQAECVDDLNVFDLGNRIYNGDPNGALYGGDHYILGEGGHWPWSNRIEATHSDDISTITMETWENPDAEIVFTLNDMSDGITDGLVRLKSVTTDLDGNAVWANPPDNQLNTGLYKVVDGSKLVLIGQAHGEVTFVADDIIIGGSSAITLTAYEQGVLAYCSGESSYGPWQLDGIMIVAGNAHLTGMLYAPGGEVVVAGWNSSFNPSDDIPLSTGFFGEDWEFGGKVTGLIAGQHVWLIGGNGCLIQGPH